jgi:hypothetical protein
MGFWKRFKFFAIGLSIGTLTVYVIFGTRDWTSWTPEGRVLITIKQAEFKATDLAECQIACIGLERDSISKRLIQGAQVNFKLSETQKKPCPIYDITIADAQLHYKLEMCERDSLVNLISIDKAGLECDC